MNLPRILSLNIKIVEVDMKKRNYLLRIFEKGIYKLDNTIDPKAKVTTIETKNFKSPTPMQNPTDEIQPI